MIVKRFDSAEGNVWKYVFDFGNAIAEAVLYKYDSFYKRTVICVSVQSGCPVGCTFCGTGKRFIRNLTAQEIFDQVIYALTDMEILDIDDEGERFQIMFMSMGEPLLNMDNVLSAIDSLTERFPDAELLVSTIAPNRPEAISNFLHASMLNNRIGLQFSVHEAYNWKRNQLIPYQNKLNLRQIRDLGIQWHKITGRPVYINYCVGDDNRSAAEMASLKDLFSPVIFNFTFSVICSADENLKSAGYRDLDKITELTTSFVEDGYNVRVFNPAGQDDIGGGCGQLWYVQDWMKINLNK